MAATHFTRTWNNRVVHVIEADLADISVASIDGSVRKSSYYGVNGTFFSGTTLLGIAMNNGSAVRTGGTASADACSVTTKRGVMYCFDPYISNTFLATSVVKDYSEYPGANSSNVKWAIGGYSLQHFGQDLTETEYYNSINGYGSSSSCTAAKANTENAYRLDPTILRPRTAIGYKGGLKIVLAVFTNETAYQVRQFMINDRNCSMAIMLDGGGSSQMRWPGENNYFDPTDDNRSVYNMIRVNF